jgi:hypothetical protein
MAPSSRLSRLKDRVLEQVALAIVNRKWLARYGRATCLRLDSAGRKIYIEVELKGESVPVEIEIIDYEIRQDGERYFAIVKEIRTSREWLTTLATEQWCNSRFEVPAKLGRWLMLAL